MKLLLLSAVALFTLPAHALMGSGGEGNHLLSVGAGISSPSVTTALGENPAGLVNNQRFKLLGHALAENTDLDPLGYGGTVFTGNGTVGVGLGYSGVTGAGGGGSLVFGLAAEARALRLAFGAAGSYALQDSGAGRMGLDLGILFNSKGDLTIGATAFGVANGPDAYGAGISYAMSPQAKLVVDASVTDQMEGLTIKPALGVSVDRLQLSFGYGIQLDDLLLSHIREGAALGIGIELGERFHLQAYYNQIARYFLGVTIRF